MLNLVTVKRMSPLVRQIDFALEWMLVEAGKALYRYIVSYSSNNRKLICSFNVKDKITSLKMFTLYSMDVFEVFYRHRIENAVNWLVSMVAVKWSV